VFAAKGGMTAVVLLRVNVHVTAESAVASVEVACRASRAVGRDASSPPSAAAVAAAVDSVVAVAADSLVEAAATERMEARRVAAIAAAVGTG